MRFVTASAFVDSASPGRNDVDSLRSASENLPGSFAATVPAAISAQIRAMTHFVRHPATKVNSELFGAGL
ncbi:MAG TPA: hypothetical protein VHZ31_01190 [Solirubrobacteraceae bacterium]|jgi:hypothetical protein|nr:hypothetical protein [Solirubrobacteraceae bacterium]